MEKASVILLTFLLYAVGSFAQSQESDEMYAQGMELFATADYSGAEKIFQKVSELDYSQMDSTNVRRDYSKQWWAHSLYMVGDTVHARQIDSRWYRVKPQDRRRTLVVDSLTDVIMKNFEKGLVISALKNLRKMNAIEQQLCDSLDLFHAGTYDLLANAFARTQQIDSAIYYLEKKYQVEQVSYVPNDTLLLSTLIQLFGISTDQRVKKLDKGLWCLDIMDRIIATNNLESSPMAADLSYNRFMIYIMLGRNAEVDSYVDKYIEIQRMCFANDKKLLGTILGNIGTILDKTNFQSASSKIRGAILSLKDKSDIEDYATQCLLYCMSLPNQKKFNEADSLLNDLIDISKKGKTRKLRSIYAAAMSVKVVNLINNKKFDDAMLCYDVILKDSLEQYLDTISIEYFTFLLSKYAIELKSLNFNRATVVAKQLVSCAEKSGVSDPGLYMLLGLTTAYAGNYNEANEAFNLCLEYYHKNVIEPKTLFRVDKDIKDINQILNELGRYGNFDCTNHADSATYLVKGFKADLKKMKIKLYELYSNYFKEENYIRAITDYAWELKSQKKFFEAQEVMNDYYKKWQDLYSKINPIAKDEESYWSRFDLNSALEFSEFHEYRVQMYEKGDPNGVKAYQDYVNFYKEIYGDKLKDKYLKALTEYYRYTDNHEELAKLILNNKTLKLNDIKGLVDEYKAMGDNTHWLQYAKAYLNKALKDSVSCRDIYKNSYILYDMIEYWHSHGKDDDIIRYYKKELYPILGGLEPQAARENFFMSIFKLKRFVSDDKFESVVDGFVNRNSRLFDSKRHILLLIAKSDVLRTIKNYENKALVYLDEAESTTEDNRLKTKILNCKFEIKKDSLPLGTAVYTMFKKDPLFRRSTEYPEFIDGYVSRLKYADKFEEAKNIAEGFLVADSLDSGKRQRLLKDIDEDLLKFCTYTDYTSGLESGFIREQLVEVMSKMGKNTSISQDLALKVIKDNIGTLNTSIHLNSIRDYQINDLVGLSSKLACDLQSDSLLIYAYDMALLCKGLRLRSYNTMMAMIRQSGHRTLISKANDLLSIIKQMDTAQGDELKSLAERRKKIEEELYKSSNLFGNYMKRLYASWKDVKSGLKEREVAIEFTSAEENYTDVYYACVIAPEYDTPKIVRLCPNDSLKLTEGKYCSNTTVSRNVWAPLRNYLTNRKNVYISPIGILNDIPLESLQYFSDTTKCMSDVYNIYRVSSTRELIKTGKIKGEGSIVYGGLRYDTSIENLEKDSHNYPGLRIRSIGNISPFLKSRGNREAEKGVPYLPGTKTEVQQIYKTMEESTMPTELFIDDRGTEASFKSNNGQRKKIIHIATHGFYFTEKEAQELYDEDYKKSNSQRSSQDRAMMRSGLLFAGADNMLLGDRIPDGVEDGILTSQEISTLNLTGLDLITLSACETAKGDITGDGVFGLQRGFKLAGAQSILMSLWKVDDAATCKLMTEFYTNWISKKMTKHDAFEAAKKTVRSTKGWEDPKYWAAFILLDGLD